MVLRWFAVIVGIWRVGLVERRRLLLLMLHVDLRRTRGISLGRVRLDRLGHGLDRPRERRRSCLLRRSWRWRRRRRLWGRRRGSRLVHLFLLLAGEDGRQLVDMRLEKLELLLAGLARSNNLHNSLQRRVGTSSSSEHVDDGIRGGRGRGGRGGWRCDLDWLRWLWLRRPRRGFLVEGRRDMVVFLVLTVGVRVVMSGPWGIGRGCRRLLVHWLGHLARAIQPYRQRMRLDDQLNHDAVGADLGEVLEQLFLALGLCTVLISAVGQLLGLGEVRVESAKVCARQPHGLGSLE